MARRKTQIDRAVAAIEAQIDALTTKYTAEKAGLESAITALKAQPTRKVRTPKPQAQHA